MKITIGRDPNSSIVVNPRFDTVSSNHAEIEYTADGRFLYIDHSTNGTMINNQKIHNGSLYVREGDKIFLANAYELSWPEIKSKASMGRTTVQRNIHGESGTASRETDRYAGYADAYRQPAQPQQQDYGYTPSRQQLTDEELSRWSWGGFLLGWIWALGNRVWWGLLALIPGISIIVNIILGINGTRAAWEASTVKDADAFFDKQRKWTIASLIVVGVNVLLVTVYYIVIISLI